MEKVKKILKSEYAVILICLLMMAILSIVTPSFASVSNILNIVKRTATTGIVAIGMTFVVSTGGIDLSVGGQVSLIGCIGAILLKADFSVVVTVLIMLFAGVVLGTVNGFFVSYLKLPAFMVTMAMVNVTQGLAFFITTGQTIFDLPEGYSAIGLAEVAGIPLPAIYLVILAVFCQFVLKKSLVGRRILSVGGNERGAWYAGINVKFYKMLAYIICGLCSAFSGVVMSARLMSANASIGDGMELDAIAAAVIGGAALTGGFGNMIGTLAGAIILSAITNWMNLMSVNIYIRDVVKGLIIIFAIILDAFRKGELSRTKLHEN